MLLVVEDIWVEADDREDVPLVEEEEADVGRYNTCISRRSLRQNIMKRASSRDVSEGEVMECGKNGHSRRRTADGGLSVASMTRQKGVVEVEGEAAADVSLVLEIKDCTFALQRRTSPP